QIAAAGGIELGDLDPIGGGGVLDEGLEVGIDPGVDVGPAYLRVEHAGRRDGQLRRAPDDRLQELEGRDENRLRPGDAGGDREVIIVLCLLSVTRQMMHTDRWPGQSTPALRRTRSCYKLSPTS